MRKWLWGVFGFLALALGVGLWSSPAVAAYLCPSCFGLIKVEAGVYAEKGTPDINQNIQQARARVVAYNGAFDHNPTLIICHSAACHARLGSGGARAVTYGTSFIYVSPRGLQPEILAHEFSHVELHARVGLWGMLAGTIPAWFDEGMAVLVSGDQRYLNAENQAENCDAVRAAELPTSTREWRRQSGQHAQTLYHDAGCAAQARLAQRGGLAAAMRF